MIRRLTSAVGAALLVGGLGTMWYAHEQNLALRPADAQAAWASPEDAAFLGTLPTGRIMAAGIIAAAMGAGGLAAVRTTRRDAAHARA